MIIVLSMITDNNHYFFLKLSLANQQRFKANIASLILLSVLRLQQRARQHQALQEILPNPRGRSLRYPP